MQHFPDSLKSRVVYKFTCAGCGARYVAETNRHFYTRVDEHLFRDKNSHIFKHLSFSKNCYDNCDVSCFKIIDNATSFYQLKIKESFHIERLKPDIYIYELSCKNFNVTLTMAEDDV